MENVWWNAIARWRKNMVLSLRFSSVECIKQKRRLDENSKYQISFFILFYLGRVQLAKDVWHLSKKKSFSLISGPIHLMKRIVNMNEMNRWMNKSTLDNSPPPNYDKESKDECHHVNNNPRYKWYVKPAAFQVIAPTRSNYGRKINVKNRNKSAILNFFSAIIELVQELLISNMHNKFEEDM